MKKVTQSSGIGSTGGVRFYAWCGLVVGLLWLAYIFVKYNDGPFVPFREAAFDCLPLVIIAGAIVTIVRTAPALNDDDAQEAHAPGVSDTAAPIMSGSASQIGGMQGQTSPRKQGKKNRKRR